MHRLEAGNVLCLKAFGAFLYFKFHCLAFVERFVCVHHDRGEVNENIFTGLALDKTILAAPSNESKGDTRATNASQRVP